jgi:hypothetical protein
MKQTAVEWFFEQIMYADVDIKVWREILKQAKEMEKQQIETAYNKAALFKYGKEYYEETFKNIIL